MIEFIKGVLKSRDNNHILVMTESGIGYGLDISLSTWQALPPEGDCCELFTHLYVREDSLRLFGFATSDERNIFEVLIATSGIGPKLAIGILSNMPIHEFAIAITTKDIRKLVTIPAIGKKTAERLCIELKSKLNAFLKENVVSSQGNNISNIEAGPFNDAVSALIALGVKAPVAENAVYKATRTIGTDVPVEKLIKEALKHRR
jgi:holliday junction DNA helicase RuvA